MDTPSIHPKVAASSLAGALTVLLVWVLSLFDVTMPGEVGSALTVILMSVTGYMKRGTPG